MGGTEGSTTRKWTPAYLKQSCKEAKAFLTDQQYEYAVEQVLLLCEESDPSHSVLLDVEPIDEFHELRDKGGVLGKINLRVYFWIDTRHRMIVVLGVYKKEQEGKTPVRIVKRMKWRKRRAEE